MWTKTRILLDTQPEALYREISSAERYRDLQLEAVNRLIAQYHGPVYKGKDGEWQHWPENHAFESIAIQTPRLAYANPRVIVKSRRPARGRGHAIAIQHGMNRWIKDERIRQRLTQIAVDYQFCWGVTMVTNEPKRSPVAGDTRGVRWCKCYRVPFKRFLIDPVCLAFGEARWAGHIFERDGQEMLDYAKANKDSGWDADAIGRVINEGSPDALKESAMAKDVPRKRLVGYEIWVPEIDLPESPGPDAGFNGTLYTIGAANGQGVELRKPRPYYGPKTGPYSLYGCYPVPDCPFPLSTLVATAGITEELNAYARAAQKSASEYRRLILVDAANETLKQKVEKSKDSMVIPVKGLMKDAVIPIELGGITTQQVQILAMLRDRLNRTSGLSDAVRGSATGGATATADTIAAEATATRHAFVKQSWEDGVRDTLTKVAWYMYYDDEIVVPLGEDALQDFPDMLDPAFQGGVHADGSGLTFEDLELDIDPYSMPFMTDSLMQQRLMSQFELIAKAAPGMAAAPWVDWKSMLGMAGDAFNNPELDNMVDTDLLKQVQGMNLQQRAQAGMPQDQTPELGQRLGLLQGGSLPTKRETKNAPRGTGGRELRGNESGGMLAGVQNA